MKKLVTSVLSLFLFCFSGFLSFANSQEIDLAREQRLHNIAKLTNLSEVLYELEEKEFQRQLELSEEQIEEIRKLRGIVDFHLKRVMIPKSQIMDPEEHERFWDLAMTAADEVIGGVNKTMLKHQRELYKQIKMQKVTGVKSSIAGMTHPKLAEILGLTDEQKKKIKAISDEFEESVNKRRETLDEKIKKIVRKYHDESLKQLDSGQRSKYEEIFGDESLGK